MLTRFLGGIAVCIAATGMLAAQQPYIPASPYPTRQVAMQPPTVATPDALKNFKPSALLPAPSAPTVPPVLGTPPTPGTQSAPPMMAAPTMQAPALAAPAYYAPGAIADPAGVCPTGACPQIQGCAACDCLCGPPGRFWVSAEYLYWQTQGQNLPPLVTQSPAGTIRDNAGVIGTPGTRILYGNNNGNEEWRSGFRISAGMWLDECQRFGIGGDFFFLQPSNESFGIGSPGDLILSRPFVNAANNANAAQLVSFRNDAQLVAFPGVLSGSVNVTNRSNVLGGGVNFINNLCCDPCGRLDFTLGYRYLNLRDEIVIREDLTALAGSSVPAGTRFQIEDRFKTDNDFHGVNLGLGWERRFSHFFVGVRGSVALGVTATTVEIDGSTVITPPGGAPQRFVGGLLAQPTNIGRYNENSFSVVPEIGVRFGVQVTEHMRAFVSYNYLYWSNVARAGDQIDLRVNTNQIAPPSALNGPAVPGFNLQKTGFWMHGVGVGIELRY